MNTLTLVLAIGAIGLIAGAVAIAFVVACVCVGVLWRVGTTVAIISFGLLVDCVERELVRGGIIVPRLPWPDRWRRVWIGKNEYSRFRTLFSANEPVVRFFVRTFRLAPLLPG